MKSSRFTILLAVRDARASWRRLMLLTAAVMAGVGALVAINSFTDNIRVSLADQAQELLGADLAIRSRQALDTNTAAIALIDSIGALAPGDTCTSSGIVACRPCSCVIAFGSLAEKRNPSGTVTAQRT